ncbi:hypothetical protein [Pseudonocardia nigra]|nr:hypothetical protein [Pseudonocardia nigra]
MGHVDGRVDGADLVEDRDEVVLGEYASASVSVTSSGAPLSPVTV